MCDTTTKKSLITAQTTAFTDTVGEVQLTARETSIDDNPIDVCLTRFGSLSDTPSTRLHQRPVAVVSGDIFTALSVISDKEYLDIVDRTSRARYEALRQQLEHECAEILQKKEELQSITEDIRQR